MISLLLLPLVLGLTTYMEELPTGMFVWIPGLGLVLFAAARLARSGRVRTA
jgi:hypothetical protein